MSIEETPIDCFRVMCRIIGTDEQIAEEKDKYMSKYPYMSYGTRIADKQSDGIILVRFRTVEACVKACTHVPNPNPVGEDTKPEKGKDHTIFQTTT